MSDSNPAMLSAGAASFGDLTTFPGDALTISGRPTVYGAPIAFGGRDFQNIASMGPPKTGSGLAVFGPTEPDLAELHVAFGTSPSSAVTLAQLRAACSGDPTPVYFGVPVDVPAVATPSPPASDAAVLVAIVGGLIVGWAAKTIVSHLLRAIGAAVDAYVERQHHAIWKSKAERDAKP